MANLNKTKKYISHQTTNFQIHADIPSSNYCDFGNGFKNPDTEINLNNKYVIRDNVLYKKKIISSIHVKTEDLIKKLYDLKRVCFDDSIISHENNSINISCTLTQKIDLEYLCKIMNIEKTNKNSYFEVGVNLNASIETKQNIIIYEIIDKVALSEKALKILESNLDDTEIEYLKNNLSEIALDINNDLKRDKRTMRI